MPTRWLLLRVGAALVWGGIYASQFVWPTGAAGTDPALRLSHLGVALAIVILGVVDVRSRVLLADDGVVVVRGFWHRRIAWADIRQVRARKNGFGPGWVELLRISSRRVVRLPVDAQQYRRLRER
ncbi:hypothetical protein [Terrabacter sp. 2YAF2]|uniref:hypothetical protein n=1 Tax=Terrabacter sp. 2YAF2 TaxID=3233026 RepID=UPI003F948075